MKLRERERGFQGWGGRELKRVYDCEREVKRERGSDHEYPHF